MRQDHMPFPASESCEDPQTRARIEAEVPLDALDRYKLAVELCPVPALLMGPCGNIRITNAALDTLFGYPSGALTHSPVERLVPLSSQHRHPTLREAYQKMPCRRGMGAGRAIHGQRADGSFIPVEIALSPVELGGHGFVFTTVTDITDRRLNEKRLRDALDAAATAMVLVAPDGTIELVNSEACRLLGGLAEDLVGRNVDMLVPAEHRLKHSVYRHSYLAAPRPRTMTQGRSLFVQGLDGRETPVHIALTPITGGDAPRTMATIVDMSDILAQEEELQKRNARLSALNEELTQFAYSASHDLRAPLATIAGLLELGLEDLADGEIDECRRNITDALATSRRNIRKVEQVLTLARAGLDAIPEEEIDLVEVARALWDDLSCDGKAKPAFGILALGSPVISVERPTLVTVIENLLSNACRFQDPAKEYPWIALRIATDAGGLTLQVSDNGIGIPQADQTRVFDMFRRSSKSSGHGLGLALVQKHVRRLDGRIALESSPDGTCFTITIPDRSH